MGGQVMRRSFEPHEQPVPDASLTFEEFKARYGFAHRRAICDAVTEAEMARVRELHAAGWAPTTAFVVAHGEFARAREAMRLVSGVHPPPYRW